MNRYSELFLIDANPHRRADRAKVLAGSRFQVTHLSSMHELSGNRAQRALIILHDEGVEADALLSYMRQHQRWSPVLAYGDSSDPVVISKLILDGLVAYLPSQFLLTDFEDLLAVTAEQITNLIDLRYGSAAAKRKIDLLTARELEILDQLQFGLSNSEIAQDLGISVRTVEEHRYRFIRKLKVRNSASAIRLRMFSTFTR